MAIFHVKRKIQNILVVHLYIFILAAWDMLELVWVFHNVWYISFNDWVLLWLIQFTTQKDSMTIVFTCKCS